MKRKEGKQKFYLVYTLFFIIILLLLISSFSAGFSDWIKGITGKATTNTVKLNITVGVPRIITVWNDSTITINEAPNQSYAIINFSVYLYTGAAKLNDSSARLNLTRTGESLRQNSSCKKTASSGNYANYSCSVLMLWWDADGTWNIGAYIKDNESNGASNTTQIQQVGQQTGFVLSPVILTWENLSQGATNQTPINDPIILNNTGNIFISSISVNATNLRGESDSTLALWAGNFSVSWNTGGTPPAECSGTTMNPGVFTQVSTANITKGNYFKNDGTAQERLYLCLKIVGTELSTQRYSTSNESSWTIKIPSLI